MPEKVDRAAPFHQDFAGRLRALADDVEQGRSDPSTLRTLDAIKLVLLGATVAADSAHRVGRMTLLGAIERTVLAQRHRAIEHANALRATGAALSEGQKRLAEERAPSWPDPALEWSQDRDGRRFRTPKHELDRIARTGIAEALKRGPSMSDKETAREVRMEFA